MDTNQLRESEYDSVSVPSQRVVRNESCVIYEVSSKKNGTPGERVLSLTIHFQKADFPSVFSGKPAIFSYTVKKARLELSLHEAKMGIADIVAVEKFHAATEHENKIKDTSEVSTKVAGKGSFSSETIGANGLFERNNNTTKSAEQTKKVCHSSVGLKYLSNKLIHWFFYPNESHEFLSGTLSEQPLGKVQSCGKKSCAHTSIMVLERDIDADAPADSKNMGLKGFVAFKVQRAAIAKAMNHGSFQEILL